MNSHIIVNQFNNFSTCKEELWNSMKNVNSCLDNTFKICLEECPNSEEINRKLEIESILDYLHDELNTGHWSEVSIHVRRAFTAASYVKSIILLKNSSECTLELLEECLKCLDMGLLLGAPLENNPDLLTNCATFLSKQITELTPKDEPQLSQNKGKRKYPDECDISAYIKVKGINIDTLHCPSLETFNNKYFKMKIPVKLQDCMTHWSAITKWVDVNYLLEVAGGRTVPIEVGSHYADENWSQKLMPLKSFIKQYFLGGSDNVGYLAQHNLFNQIPELKNDIHIPEYCCLSDCDEDGGEPDINAWFGPKGTLSPLHFDPKNNILTQVFGTKQLILFSPQDSSYLYPHEDSLLFNTSQVNPLEPDLEKYPNFVKATAYKCLLHPGEMLYIPPKWWHHVTALDKSFSVSFWWN